MLVSEVMTKKVSTIFPDTKFSEIVRLLVKKKISGVPVVSKNGKVVGIVSEKDLFHELFPSSKSFYENPDYYMNFDHIEAEDKKVVKIPAKKMMTRKVIAIAPNDHILKACSLFLLHNIRRLPVLDKGKLVGIVTTNNIYKKFLQKINS